jgi:hypothetical protein
MHEIEKSLAWSKSNSDSVDSFYDASFSATLKHLPGRNRASRAEGIVLEIYRSISNIIQILGVDEDLESVMVKYVTPEETGGIWTFDVRFSICGESKQVLAAAISLSEIKLSVDGELKNFIGDRANERS